ATLTTPDSAEAMAPVDLTAIVHEALALTHARSQDELGRHDARIVIETEIGSVPPVLAAPSALRDALVNVVVNAVEAMPEGGRLVLSTRARPAGVELVVEDTGPGIPDALRRRVFDPFFTTRAPRHMGLGLTVTDAVIARAGGHIEIGGSLL